MIVPPVQPNWTSPTLFPGFTSSVSLHEHPPVLLKGITSSSKDLFFEPILSKNPSPSMSAYRFGKKFLVGIISGRILNWQRSFTSGTPSLSSSASHTSPTPSRSKSDCKGLGLSGQSSEPSHTESPSKSAHPESNPKERFMIVSPERNPSLALTRIKKLSEGPSRLALMSKDILVFVTGSPRECHDNPPSELIPTTYERGSLSRSTPSHAIMRVCRYV